MDLVHHARFVGQAIYYLKLNILEHHINIQSTAFIKEEVDSIEEFVALFNGRWFLTNTLSPAEAP